jgi:formamidopyrimidine-DNA glycosylase
MPELPDIAVYVEHIAARVTGKKLSLVRLSSPFVVRTFEPRLEASFGCEVRGVLRSGKRIVLALDGDLFIVLHLMIAGRLHWKPAGAKIPGKIGLAAFDFEPGTLLLTEASTKKRASIHVLLGRPALEAMGRGGIEVLEADLDAFRRALVSESHTLKRALTDPRLFSGIGNAYSDEILFSARLSPVRLTRSLAEPEIAALFRAVRTTLEDWTARLRDAAGPDFPEGVTAFRDGMAVHGRFGKPCPVCSAPVQRIVHASNETNYCARCQTGGKLLADRALSRLLKGDWPKSIDELS